MFSECISDQIHPATWAVLGVKSTPKGDAFGHRGTGFAVSEDGHLLTCWHVTYEDPDQEIDFERLVVLQPEISTSKPVKAEILVREKHRDLAVLEIQDEDVETTPVEIYKGDRIPYGASCGLFGHPLSKATPDGIRIFTRASAGALSMPYVTPRFPGCDPVRLYELDFFSHGGSSGGPVFLPDGRVFGVVSGSLLIDTDGTQNKRRSNLSVAIDIAEGVQLLDGVGVDV